MRLNGGEFLLNLLVLGALTISSESVTITDESVIKQLTGLKNYINNEKAIKPLFVKYDNGTEIVVGKGEVRKTKGALSFELVCVTKSNSLTINVAFTQKVNANDDLIDDYEIESGDATLTFTNELPIIENIIDDDGLPVIYSSDGIPLFPEGIVTSVSFIKCVRNYNELQFIFNCRITNDTESSITITADREIARFLNIPSALRQKIFNHNGQAGGLASIAYTMLFISNTGGTVTESNPRYANLYGYQDYISLFLEGNSFSVPAGTSYDLEARISLWL